MVQLDDYLIKLAADLPRRFEYARILRKRFIFEELQNKVDSFISSGKPATVLLPGLRGTGKTTLLAQLYFYTHSSTSAVIYLPVDELNLLGFTLIEAVERYLEIFRPERPVFLLDEVQYDEKWPLTLKVLDDRKKFLIIATGSSALNLKESPDLARRAEHIHVYPLTFREYLYLSEGVLGKGTLKPLLDFDVESIERSVTESAPYIWKAEEYLRAGSLPFSFDRKEPEVYEAVFTLIERMVYRDLPQVKGFDSQTLERTLKLLFLLANPKGERFSYERLSKILGMAKGTIISIINALIKVGILVEIPSMGGMAKKVRKDPKLKFLAPALRAALLYKSGELEKGLPALLEDAVAFYLSKIGKLEYEPGKGGADFLLTVDGRKYIVEVGLGKDSVTQVKKSMERVGADRGIVIGEKFYVADNILSIPWRAFLAMI
ncbi:ATP-binding protein [Thermococcus sp. MV5]|uniref:ATP-binding protein n=1 Tax=Thermococcus sp. MV5 TaxID=1638272 RepID=UPI00143BAA6B|nr:ATP-binding protein [Thermococcus sp. MV5]NJE25901.1 ATP-binding protein [Thermococcus sp. MV5]